MKINWYFHIVLACSATSLPSAIVVWSYQTKVVVDSFTSENFAGA